MKNYSIIIFSDTLMIFNRVFLNNKGGKTIFFYYIFISQLTHPYWPLSTSHDLGLTILASSPISTKSGLFQ